MNEFINNFIIENMKIFQIANKVSTATVDLRNNNSFNMKKPLRFQYLSNGYTFNLKYYLEMK